MTFEKVNYNSAKCASFVAKANGEFYSTRLIMHGAYGSRTASGGNARADLMKRVTWRKRARADGGGGGGGGGGVLGDVMPLAASHPSRV